jgi:hypothetical protein
MRVIFLIDGFNLYHSISDAQKDSGLGSKLLKVNLKKANPTVNIVRRKVKNEGRHLF